ERDDRCAGAETGTARASPARLSSVPCGSRNRGVTPITVGAPAARSLNTKPPPTPVPPQHCRARSVNRQPPYVRRFWMSNPAVYVYGPYPYPGYKNGTQNVAQLRKAVV